ncbi:YciI family protein [Lysinibacter cavernae]|uniref:YCII-related domain-containing protein n=1 Tax=Lysinibacter cavernae TaxID=1640652 RepID=A0A7X5R2X5_9MICO|nr:YciI family protein [Lysinibacter cavernae]NIH54537.1 hypothetical protein [Lysinibacter cavernae]
MTTFAVTYSYSTDAENIAKRDAHRPAHVEFLTTQFNAQRLLVSGPFGPEEAPGALLIFNAESKAALETLLNADPFHVQGLIAERNIRQWNIFFGEITPAAKSAA